VTAKFRLSRVAQSDFDEIIDYLVQVAGSRVASEYGEKIRASINRVAQSPGIGTPWEGIGADARVTGVRPYLIFYDGGPDSNVVHVLRILHGRRNITPDLVARGREP
jgi:toxin ParE1/3/4